MIAAAVAFKNGIGGAVVAGVSAVLLLIAQSEINKEALKEGQGIITVNFQLGYYAALLLLIGGAVLGIVAAKQKKKIEQGVAPNA